MHRLRQILQLIVCAVPLVGLLSCSGEKTKSQHTTVTVLPKKPIVITGPYQVGGREVAGPWFRFSASITNNTEEPITIVAVKLEVELATSASSRPAEVNFTPGMYNKTLLNLECQYTSFGTIEPGATGFLRIDHPNANCASGPIALYPSALPKDPTDTSFYRYRVKLTPIGWFGSETDPTDRYDRSVTFFTQ